MKIKHLIVAAFLFSSTCTTPQTTPFNSEGEVEDTGEQSEEICKCHELIKEGSSIQDKDTQQNVSLPEKATERLSSDTSGEIYALILIAYGLVTTAGAIKAFSESS